MNAMSRDDRDLQALRAVLAGRPGSRDELVAALSPFVRWVVRETRAAPVDDLCQEVFLALFENDARRLRQFDPARGTLRGWVGMVARQTALKRSRRAVGAPAPLPADLETAPSPVDPDSLAALREGLKRLPSREALCLGLLFEQGLSADRAAGILGVRRQGVYEIRDRALARLRGILGKSGD